MPHVNLDLYHFFDSDRIACNNPVMLEVGAFCGDLAFEFLGHYPAGNVVIYEADAINFSTLAESVQNDPRIRIRHEAVAGYDGTVTLHSYTDRYSHSIFDRACDNKVPTVTTEVPCVTLATALRENEHGRVDFLLLNCEGCELPVLQQVVDMPAVRDQIPQICVSFHCLHSKMYCVEERDALLAQLGQWFDVRVGNATWEYFLLVKKHGC